MGSTNWVIVKKEMYIDTNSLLSFTRYLIIAERLTEAQSKSYLNESSPEIIALTNEDLYRLKSSGAIIKRE